MRLFHRSPSFLSSARSFGAQIVPRSRLFLGESVARRHFARGTFGFGEKPRPKRGFVGEVIAHTSPGILLVGGVILVGGATFYVINLDETEITHRKRFLIMSREQEERLGASVFTDVVRQNVKNILPSSHPDTIAVRKCLMRLVRRSEMESLQRLSWEVVVIRNDKTANAFVLPGGKVVVFTGIFPAARDEQGLATVLSHEVSHVLLRHGAERFSSNMVIASLLLAASAFFGVPISSLNMFSKLLLELPNSRLHELEADAVGLILMARACYKPAEAVAFWQRMDQLTKSAPPQWMSTHPANATRIQQVKDKLPEVLAERDQFC